MAGTLAESEILLKTEGMNGLMNKVLSIVGDALGADEGCIHLLDQKGHSLEVKAIRGTMKEQTGKLYVTMSEWLKDVMSKKQDAEDDPDFQSLSICAPLFFKEKAVGMMTLVGKMGGGQFTSKDLDVLCSFSGLVSLVLEVVFQGEQAHQQTVNKRSHYEKLASMGEIAAGIAHEINNPLTAITTYSEVLLKNSRGLSPDAQQQIGNIAQSSRRIGRIVRGFLDFSRKKERHVGLMDLNRLVRETLLILEHILSHYHSVEIETEFAGGPLEAFADRDELQQVLINMVTNAVQAMPRGGKVTITTRHTDQHVEIAVSDTGGGINPEDIPFLFEPFFTTKGDGEGTGVGLSICRRIIEKHGGTIHVDSVPGKGATFTVRLPLPALVPLGAENGAEGQNIGR